MPIGYRIDVKRRRVVAEVVDDFDLADVLGVVDDATHDPDFEPGFDVYSDHTRINHGITTEQVLRLSKHLESLRSKMAGARWAVVTRKAVSYGMMRMMSAYLDEIPIDVQVFYDADEAEAWLASPKEPPAR